MCRARPTPRPATATGRQSCSPATVNASTTAINQPTAITMMTGHGSSRIAGRAGGSGSSGGSVGSDVIGDQPNPDRPNIAVDRVWPFFTTPAGYSLLCEGYRIPVGERLVAGGYATGTPITFSPPGFPGFAITVVGAVDAGQRGRDDARSVSHPRTCPAAVDDARHRLTRRPRICGANRASSRRPSGVGVGFAAGAELIEAERRASQEWLKQRLSQLNADQRKTLLVAADLMSALVDESA